MKPRISIILVIISGLFLSFFASISFGAGPDLIVRMGKLSEALQAADEISASIPGIILAPGTFVEGQLGGTDWIDSKRSIVIGISFPEKFTDDAKPEIVGAVIPYTREMPIFEKRYKAIKRSGYYLVASFTGQSGVVPGDVENALVAEMRRPPERFLSAYFSPSALIEKYEDQIEESIKKLQEKAGQEKAGAGQGESAQALEAIRNFTALLKEIDRFSIGIDLDLQNIALSFSMAPSQGSEFAKLLKDFPGPQTVMLAGLTDCNDAPVAFRSRPMNLERLFVFITSIVDKKSLGGTIDPEDWIPVLKYFTGESRGCVRFQGKAIDMNTIMVLDPKTPADFLEKRYIPLVLDYGKKAARFYSKIYPGLGDAPLFSLQAKKRINDKPVFLLKCNWPAAATGGPVSHEVEFELCQTGNFLLVASSDDEMASLLNTIKKTGKAKTAQGPLIQARIDIARIMGQEPLKTSFTLNYTVDVQDNLAELRYAFKTQELKDFVATASQTFFQAMAQPQVPGQGEIAGPENEVKPGSQMPAQKTRELTPDDPLYHYNKGELFITYGNRKAAISAFDKAISMDPDFSDAWCESAIAYAELGFFDEAQKRIERALSISPGRADFIYARGWILMKMGKIEKGLADIRKAAEMGNAEAQAYLMTTAK